MIWTMSISYSTKAFFSVYILLILLLQTGCSRNLFSVNLFVVDEKTALEQQVLGTYSEIGRDLDVFASVRAVNPDGSLETPPEMTEQQKALTEAMNNRRYNRDDVDQLLLARIVGEGNQGFLVKLVDSAPEDFELSSNLIEEVLREENQDRTVLLDRLMLTPGVTPRDKEEVSYILAELNQDLAPPGSRIQSRAGQWTVK